jgi:protein deglycase
MSKKVLCLLANGFEEIETITPVDVLRRAGVEVVLAAVGDGIHVTGRSGIVIHADAKLADLEPQDFDLLFIPGGPGVSILREDGRPAQIAADFASMGRPVAAICAAPLVLLDAGLLRDKNFTAHHSTIGELPRAFLDQRVVRDGQVITSRGAGTALDLGLALAELLAGAEEREKVAAAIMA